MQTNQVGDLPTRQFKLRYFLTMSNIQEKEKNRETKYNYQYIQFE